MLTFTQYRRVVAVRDWSRAKTIPFPKSSDFWVLAKKAETSTNAMAKDCRALLIRALKRVSQRVEEGDSAENAFEAFEQDFEYDLQQIKVRWAFPLALDGYRIAEGLVRKVKGKSLVVDVSQFGRDELVANHMKPGIAKWIERTSRIETASTASQIERTTRAAFATLEEGKGATPKDLARKFQEIGVAQSESRATLLARTTTNWAYNAGAKQQYLDTGFTQGVWVATEDDASCEFCMAMDGQVFNLGENIHEQGGQLTGTEGGVLTLGIDVENPPLHPHCRCTIMPEAGSVLPTPTPQIDPVSSPAPAPAPIVAPPTSTPTPPKWQVEENRFAKPDTADPLVGIEYAEKELGETGFFESEEYRRGMASGASNAEKEAMRDRLLTEIKHRNALDEASLPEQSVERIKRIRESLTYGSTHDAQDLGLSKAVAVKYREAVNKIYDLLPSEILKLPSANKYSFIRWGSTEGMSAYGEASRFNQSIRIRKGLGGNQLLDTCVHEFGHHIEYNEVGQAKRRFKTWILERQKTRPARHLTQYASGAEVDGDHFYDPYIGKMYRDGSTEAWSVGMETLRNPVSLVRAMKKDPEYVKLVYTAMRGG